MSFPVAPGWRSKILRFLIPTVLRRRISTTGRHAGLAAPPQDVASLNTNVDRILDILSMAENLQKIGVHFPIYESHNMELDFITALSSLLHDCNSIYYLSLRLQYAKLDWVLPLMHFRGLREVRLYIYMRASDNLPGSPRIPGIFLQFLEYLEPSLEALTVWVFDYEFISQISQSLCHEGFWRGSCSSPLLDELHVTTGDHMSSEEVARLCQFFSCTKITRISISVEVLDARLIDLLARSFPDLRSVALHVKHLMQSRQLFEERDLSSFREEMRERRYPELRELRRFSVSFYGSDIPAAAVISILAESLPNVEFENQAIHFIPSQGMKGVCYAIAAATTLWVAAIVVIRRKRSVVNCLRGPPSPSWLLGNEQDILRQSEVGNIESRWIREYGTTFKISSCYRRAGIFTVDPRAIQHIFQTAGYRYSRRADTTQMNRNMFGRSILSASPSEVHQRHRKVMNPVFTAQQLRGFLPVFQTVASRMTQKLKDQIQNGEERFNIISWLGRCTLDAIGTAAFNYPFGALEDSHEDELSQSLENLFADTLPFPPKWDLLFKSAWRYIPTSILQLVEYMPTKEYRRFRRFRKLCRGVAKALIRENAGATHSDIDREFGENSAGSKRDFMSVMARANDSEDPKRQLDEDEVLSQMGTLILVGHDTTANTLSWLLYELSKHLDDQERVRDEIQARRAQLPSGAPFTISDLESLTFTNATIKEALRLHPIVFELRRTAERDDTIPLDIPIVTTDGEVIKELPIRKGQDLFISISGYNRLPSIWGDDADAWNPRRFIDVPRKENEKRTAVGVYANLMSFSGGVRACIGWRFALIELQALVVEMIENFTVSLPDGVEISRLPAGMMIPVVKDKLDEGTQMPLVLSLVE
ncbi:hypothetical protein EYR38_009188 [Pleurotus pulmonarius]|nr:hypothetical protein EYR38_009188 [Pleurotus pulmonarius]